MNQIINYFLKIVFFIIFYVVITPVGLCLRLVGIDYLQRRFEREEDSYWIVLILL